jgi:hypothetical protein
MNIGKNGLIAQNFWQYAIPEPNSGCLLWTAAASNSGYGTLSVNGKTVSAHRYAYALTFGAIPHNFHVLHKCDTPICINPQHLFLGTDKDNGHDRARKQRNVNVLTDANKAKQFCINGHALTTENVYHWANRRLCRECRRINAKSRKKLFDRPEDYKPVRQT